MNIFVLIVSLTGVAAEILKQDYWHAATWVIVGLGAFISILDDHIIKDLKQENAALRSCRDAWEANARANTSHRKGRPDEHHRMPDL